MSFGGGAASATGDANRNGILDDLELAQFEAEQQAARESAQKAEKEAELGRLTQLGATAYSGAQANAQSELASYGVDPNNFGAVIDRVLNSIKGTIGPNDPNPAQYYTNAGSRVVDEATDQKRRELNRQIDTYAPYNFEATRIPYTIDDPTQAAVLAEERAKAEEYLTNLLTRGLINETGRAGGQRELDRQSNTVQALLDELGTGLIEGGRSNLRGTAGTARTGAATYQLGQAFDPDQYRTQLDQQFNDFINNLGTRFRGRVTGPLFSTKGLAAIAGSAQGAQNTPFDPNALAGVFNNDNEDENAPSGSSVFL